MAITSLAPLPTEILQAVVRTFRSDRDLVFLWTVLRDVNHLFRALVDDWVRRRHLRTMSIIPTSVLMNASDAANPQVRLTCPYSHISALDAGRAVFQIAPKASEAYRQTVATALATAQSMYPVHEGCPLKSDLDFTVPADQHVDPPAFVVLRRLANDTELIDCTVDAGSMQLELDWRGTIGRLIWEEKLRGTLTKAWLSRAKAMREEAQSKGETAMMKIAFQTMGARDESFANSRIKRIQRQKCDYRVCMNPPLSISPTTLDYWKPSRAAVRGLERVEMLTQSTNCWEYSDDD